MIESKTVVDREVGDLFVAVAMATVKMQSFGWLATLFGGSDFDKTKADLLKKQKLLWKLIESSKKHLAALRELERGLPNDCSGRDALQAMAAIGMNIRNLP